MTTKVDVWTCPSDHKHGATSTCYTSHLCRCQNCKDGCARRAMARRKQIAYGRWDSPRNSPVGPVIAHLDFLQERGHGYGWIAEKAGVNPRTVWKVKSGRITHVRQWTADAILAVRPNFDELHPRTIIPCIGVVRRVHALGTQGWSQRELARRLGVHEDTVSKYMYGPGVFVETHRKIAALYDELWDKKPNPRTRAERQAVAAIRTRAVRLGWVPPLGWDDESLDDPHAEPAITTTGDDVDELAVDLALDGTGEPLTTPQDRRAAVKRAHAWRWSDGLIASRIGCAERTVLRIRSELGLPGWADHEVITINITRRHAA